MSEIKKTETKSNKERVERLIELGRGWMVAYEYLDAVETLKKTSEEDIINIPDLPYWLYLYVENEILGRVEYIEKYEIEPIIVKNPHMILIYAIEIIQTSWSYGQNALIEHIKKGTPRAVKESLDYMEHFGMRWPELEELLLKRDNFQELQQYYKAIRYGVYAYIGTD